MSDNTNTSTAAATPNRKFSGYTDDEILGLSSDQLEIAIRLEAIDRGVSPPMRLSEALRKSEWTGFQIPPDHIAVYEIVVQHQFNDHRTGLAFLSQEAAEKCLAGSLSLYSTGYGKDEKWVIKDSEARILKVCIPGAGGRFISKAVRFEEYVDDTDAFDKVAQECVDRLSRVRQERYNLAVRREKKAEYLRLAGGDETIAQGFWAKVEKTEWPA